MPQKIALFFMNTDSYHYQACRFKPHSSIKSKHLVLLEMHINTFVVLNTYGVVVPTEVTIGVIYISKCCLTGSIAGTTQKCDCQWIHSRHLRKVYVH